MSCEPDGTDPGEEPAPVAPPSRRARLRDWISGRRQRLDDARSTSTSVDFAFDALSYDTDTGAPVLAAALAFRVFLFLVPYVCVFVILAGFFADVTGRDTNAFIHGSGIAKLTADAVSGAAEFSGWTRASAFVITAYALFLSARAFLKVVNIVYALVWNVPRTKLLRASRAALAFIGLLTLAVAVSLAIGELRGRSAIGGLIAMMLYTIALFALWWIASLWLPHRECPPIALAPGAVLFAVAVEILHVGTVIWLPHHLDNKSEVYGSIGISLGLLLWAYILGRIVTLAVVLNAALWSRFGPDAPNPLRVRQPAWNVPIIGGVLSRVWNAIFGPEESNPPEPPAG